ncbi:Tryptophan--tRNA ligase [Candidatus Hodgkinia cicadicola]|uniref:Tryptophan--tRNA ligase n=1 Tax=Candidatus Hodgkinia cicadicola TaxID=573658 RepID=A0ABX4MG70_9HYPH|nr:Tryptophan--tRNA ligase [Candidatus Hodgkinia cicadicola]PIM95670.1 Tryptophan--tRNA ligase [Candidatus Hodgkinia cicadicola]
MFGIKPTGQPHIANYLCLISAIRMNRLMVCLVANLHSLSENHLIDSRLAIRLMIGFVVSVFSTRLLLNWCIVYVQSYSSLSPYLNWIVMCLSKENDVYHASSSELQINFGSLLYPSLMAADIILCNPTYLCIGLDQTKHIEYTSTVIAKFNKLFEYRTFGGNYEFVSKFQCLATMMKIMSFKKPLNKMSKSDNRSAIFVLDDYQNIKSKINMAKTDRVIDMPFELNELCNRSGLSNLFSIYSLNIETDKSILLSYVSTITVYTFKLLLWKLIYFKLYNVRKKTMRYLEVPNLLDKVVLSGRNWMEIWCSSNVKHICSVAELIR